MDIMQPIDQSTALSSFPVIKETRVNKMASNSSMGTDRSSTRLSNGSISETSKKSVSEISNSSDQSATYPLDGKMANDSNQDHAIKRYISSDLKLERDRESVINLAKFLRTTNPPPNNYMSLPDASQQQSQDKKLPFKMLRRQTGKRSSDTIRTLQLPDSAVAAKTSQGHWHIAISIPVEYDHQEPDTPTQNQTTKHAKTQSGTAIRNGPITVLKPAIGNVRPAALDKMHTKPQSHDDLRRTFANPKPLSIPLLSDAEAGRSSHAFSDQKANQDVPQTLKDDQVQSSKPFSRDNAVSAGDTARPESQRSDVRNSEDTSFTVRSLDSSVCHTRGQSSISTAPSINYPASPRVIWPPKGQTSGSKRVLDQSEQSILAQLSQSAVDARADDSLRPISVGSDMSSANLKIAATAQGYGPDMPGTQVVFVRKGTQIPSYRARIARRPPKNSSAEYILSSQSTLSGDYPAAPPNGVDLGGMAKTRQSRQERVKAIRSRDMAKLRAMKKYEQVMASVAANEIPSVPGPSPSNGPRAEPYRRQAQKRSLSYASIAEETAWQKTLNSMTPVMVTADLEPSTASNDLYIHPDMLVAELEPSAASSELWVSASHLSTQRLYEKERGVSMRNSPDEAQTPPCSVPSSPTSSNGEGVSTRNSLDEAQTPSRYIMPSPASSDTETIQSLRPWPKTGGAFNSQRHGNVGKHQVELRRQKSMPDESMDIRMRRLETINAVILRTLNAVVEMGVGFRELRQLLPAESTESDKVQFHNGYNSQAADDRDPIGSLIQELRGAVKIGQEELAKYGAAV
jgi:hypothetical protein